VSELPAGSIPAAECFDSNIVCSFAVTSRGPRRMSEPAVGVDAHPARATLRRTAHAQEPTEAIVDKDNHLRDALKYILLSLPSPSEIPARLQRDDMIAEAIANGKQATLGVLMARYDAKQRGNCEPVSYRVRWPPQT
jgi:hypothetical protein